MYKKVTGKNITLAIFREQLSVSLRRGNMKKKQKKGRRSTETLEQLLIEETTKKENTHLNFTSGKYQKRLFVSLANI